MGGAAARGLARVDACADELRLMGVERAEVSILKGRVGGGRGFLSRKVSRACGLPAKEWMWSDVEGRGMGPSVGGHGGSCARSPFSSRGWVGFLERGGGGAIVRW